MSHDSASAIERYVITCQKLLECTSNECLAPSRNLYYHVHCLLSRYRNRFKTLNKWIMWFSVWSRTNIDPSFLLWGSKKIDGAIFTQLTEDDLKDLIGEVGARLGVAVILRRLREQGRPLVSRSPAQVISLSLVVYQASLAITDCNFYTSTVSQLNFKFCYYCFCRTFCRAMSTMSWTPIKTISGYTPCKFPHNFQGRRIKQFERRWWKVSE